MEQLEDLLAGTLSCPGPACSIVLTADTYTSVAMEPALAAITAA